MKKIYIKLMGLVVLLTALTACKKFIQYDPHDEFKITELDYLKSESDYRTMTVSAYTPLQWLNQVVPTGDIASDNSVSAGEGPNDVASLKQMDDFTLDATNSTLTDLWQVAYEGINRTNYLTQYKDKNLAGQTVDFAGKNALYGEITFLRAYYYFTLVKLFGDVPLFTDKRLGLGDSRSLKRAPKADVYKQIETDLLNAIAVLPPVAVVQAQPGKVTKYAAMALLGKVYLYENKFDEAKAILEPIITSGAFTLVQNFDSIFLLAGENGPESVFEIQYSNGSPYYNWGGTTRGQGNYNVQQNGVRGISGTTPYAAGWSTDMPTQELAAAYATGDQRKDATLFNMEAYKQNSPPALNIDYQVAPYRNTGFYNKKYLPYKGETSGQVELNYDNNFRTIRYAEVLLMAAEANNRASAPDDTKAQGYINQVRHRAFQDDNHQVNVTGTALKQAIWDERRLELAMEGDRFFDLVRTGQAATKLTGFKTGKNEVFPIPQLEVQISGLTQNPGY